jgi:hypothetical protein
MIQHPAEIQHWLRIAKQSESLEVECENGVEQWVFRPCIETSLAPRQARAALEIMGYLVSQGVPAVTILERMTNNVYHAHK